MNITKTMKTRLPQWATLLAEDEEVFWCWLVAVARSVARDAGRKRRRYLALLERYSRRWRALQPEPPAEDGPRLQGLLFAYRDLQRAFTDGRWKLIRYPQVNRTQLFDLRTDPHDESEVVLAQTLSVPRIAWLIRTLGRS